ncbi:MAG: hypothetical protein ABI723_08710 [Bacteroidia bacterium]
MSSTTTNELIDYLLNETELQDSVEVQHAIDTNDQVHAAYEELKESMDILDHVLMEPEQESIDIIMSYSALTKDLQS